MRIWLVVGPLLMSALLALLLGTVVDQGKEIKELQADRVASERWRGEITAKTDTNGDKVDAALADMATTKQLLNDIRVELAKGRR